MTRAPCSPARPLRQKACSIEPLMGSGDRHSSDEGPTADRIPVRGPTIAEQWLLKEFDLWTF